MTLSWPHLGLHLEISGLKISPSKLLDPILATSWASSWLFEISGLKISPSKLLDPILATSWASSWLFLDKDFTKKAFWTLSWPHLGLHLEISRLEILPRKLS